jgi:hypothetical protein
MESENVLFFSIFLCRDKFRYRPHLLAKQFQNFRWVLLGAVWFNYS